mmetsp:Transcript_38238/g.93626  ORF Transcript_38238/g.93626 Transcript_38238/m.93626 type:complete len:462 (-) Transcript_38238:1236-2621(-)
MQIVDLCSGTASLDVNSRQRKRRGACRAFRHRRPSIFVSLHSGAHHDAETGALDTPRLNPAIGALTPDAASLLVAIEVIHVVVVLATDDVNPTEPSCDVARRAVGELAPLVPGGVDERPRRRLQPRSPRTPGDDPALCVVAPSMAAVVIAGEIVHVGVVLPRNHVQSRQPNHLVSAGTSAGRARLVGRTLDDGPRCHVQLILVKSFSAHTAERAIRVVAPRSAPFVRALHVANIRNLVVRMQIKPGHAQGYVPLRTWHLVRPLVRRSGPQGSDRHIEVGGLRTSHSHRAGGRLTPCSAAQLIALKVIDIDVRVFSVQVNLGKPDWHIPRRTSGVLTPLVHLLVVDYVSIDQLQIGCFAASSCHVTLYVVAPSPAPIVVALKIVHILVASPPQHVNAAQPQHLVPLRTGSVWAPRVLWALDHGTIGDLQVNRHSDFITAEFKWGRRHIHTERSIGRSLHESC